MIAGVVVYISLFSAGLVGTTAIFVFYIKGQDKQSFIRLLAAAFGHQSAVNHRKDGAGSAHYH